MMLAFPAYTWWKFLHVAGVIAFVMFHGVSMMVALQLRTERDRGRIATMTQLSGSSLRGMYVALLWLIVFGVIAGIQGEWWNDGWFWISVGLLVVAIAEMSAVGRPYYERVKEAIEVRPSGVPRRSDEELDEILRSPIGLWNAVFGIAVLAAIAWLMIFKPFVVL
ncbi:MAG TPA: hypothetical protein VJ573_08300 [Actinomycetota bacterium]|nr:hypothetical protein [Actinomycetota bacterium]HJY32885.1 hypothetical protein [Actinomycetota bacterium]